MCVQKKELKLSFQPFVGVKGFEPSTPCSQSRCANRTALRPDSPFGLTGAKLLLFFELTKFFATFLHNFCILLEMHGLFRYFCIENTQYENYKQKDL